MIKRKQSLWQCDLEYQLFFMDLVLVNVRTDSISQYVFLKLQHLTIFSKWGNCIQHSSNGEVNNVCSCVL